MNWRLVFLLSLAAIAIALTGVYVNISSFEFWLWLVLFAIYAVIIAKNVSKGRYFHGFMTGLFSGLWVTLVHVLFFDAYMAANAESYQQMDQLPEGMKPKTLVIIMGPVIAVFSGLVAGLFAWVAGKIIKPTNQPG